jgi:D-alanine-D-alanine ligase
VVEKSSGWQDVPGRSSRRTLRHSPRKAWGQSTVGSQASSSRSRPRVCVLSGGPTLESRASRVSADGVYKALAELAYDVTWLDLSESESWEVRSCSSAETARRIASHDGEFGTWQETFASLHRASAAELVFPVIHGHVGEDGQIQALCQSLAIPCVGSDSAASIACYDKAHFKDIMRTAGIPVARSLTLEREEHDTDDAAFISAAVEREFGYPCIVKPSRSGSSLGLSRVTAPDDLTRAINAAFAFDDAVLIERLFLGCDVEVGAIEDLSVVIGIPIELEYEGVLYDFEAKYVHRDRRYVPARCSAQLIARLRHTARAAFVASGCRGMARVDFLVDPVAERFVVNEINTIPYMPESSTFATSLCHETGQTYRELVAGVVQVAWRTARAR